MSRELLFSVMLLLLGSSPASGQTDHQDAPPYAMWDQMPVVEYCDLIQNKDRYDGKLVRVRAIYLKGIEQSILSSPACPVSVATWLEKANLFHRVCPSRKVELKMLRTKPDRSVDVLVSGKFEVSKGAAGQGFGAQGKYSTRFLFHCVLDVKPLGRFKPLPDKKM